MTWQGRPPLCFSLFLLYETKGVNSTKMYYSKHKTINGKPISGKEGRKRRKRDRGTYQKQLSSIALSNIPES